MIEDEILSLVMDKIKEKATDNSNRNDDLIHVSDLTNPCMYSRLIKEPMTQEKIYNFFVGRMLHEFLPIAESYNNEIHLKSNIYNLSPYVDGLDKNKYHCLEGTIDDVIDNKIIIDKKTYNSNKYIPKTIPINYKIQLDCYRLLLYCQTLGHINIKTGAIVYFDVANKFKPMVMTTELADIMKTRTYVLNRLKEIQDYETKGITPTPNFNCCNMCFKKKLCDKYAERQTKI